MRTRSRRRRANRARTKIALTLTPRAKRSLALSLIASGAVLSALALWLCFVAYPMRPRDVSGILLVRGAFLVCGIAIALSGAWMLPTRRHTVVVRTMFLLPVLVPFVITIVIPLLAGMFYSFTDWDGNRFTTFVGLSNYTLFFKASDYVNSAVMTVLFAVVNVLVVNITAFLLSLLVTRGIKGTSIYRAGFFLPNLIGGIVLGYVWQFLFNNVFVAIVKMLGASDAESLLNTPVTALAAMVIVSTWQYAGYIMMIYVTALQGIPKTVIEAAKIDGASGWTRTQKLIIPMIAHAFTICIFLTLVNSFKQFDLNLSLTNGGPSRILMGKAIMSTELQALNIYKTAIVRNQWAIAQAKSVVFFVALALVSLLQVRASKHREEEA